MSDKTRTFQCACGAVRFEAYNAPILTAVCYCQDCQAGGKLIESLPNAKPVLDADNGTSYLTYRDDRYRCIAGQDNLRGHKLKPKSPTTRYVASCCQSAMYLKFHKGHWVSTYRNRFVDDDLPPNDMRTNTRSRTSNLPIPTDAPSYRRFPLKLFGKLIAARINMALGR